ncbi:MAG: response regulator [Ilumatobacteraceae bacterium]
MTTEAVERFDVAFVDVQMPGISGLELVSMAMLGERRPVTAIMTASATAADRTAALEAGADHFVPSRCSTLFPRR